MAKKKHEHGSMDVSNHHVVFDGFIRISMIIAAVSIGVLIFLALFNS